MANIDMAGDYSEAKPPSQAKPKKVNPQDLRSFFHNEMKERRNFLLQHVNSLQLDTEQRGPPPVKQHHMIQKLDNAVKIAEFYKAPRP